MANVPEPWSPHHVTGVTQMVDTLLGPGVDKLLLQPHRQHPPAQQPHLHPMVAHYVNLETPNALELWDNVQVMSVMEHVE